MTKIADLKKRWMADPAFRNEYKEADEEYAIIEELIRARTKAKVSKSALELTARSNRSAARRG